MHLLLEFSDSEVSRIEPAQDGLHILFSAAQVARLDDSVPGRSEAGFARSVELIVAGATLSEPYAELIGRVAQGRVAVGDAWHSRLPLPSITGGPVRLELAFANRTTLSVAGDAIECRFFAGPNFAESLFC